MCAAVVTSMVSDIVSVANDFAQAAVDCTVPDFDELSCANDLAQSMRFMTELAAFTSLATSTCGTMDNLCASIISFAISDMAWASQNLIAAAGDCVNDPFICTFDVVEAVNNLNNFVNDVMLALPRCMKQRPEPNPGRTSPAAAISGRPFDIVDGITEITGPDDLERRLREEVEFFGEEKDEEAELIVLRGLRGNRSALESDELAALDTLREEVRVWRLEVQRREESFEVML